MSVIYQYNKNLEIIGEYRTLKEAQEATGIKERTICAAILERSFCRHSFYFARDKGFVPTKRIRAEKAGKRLVIMLTDRAWDDLLEIVGQRNKQDILREVVDKWITENKKS